MHQVRARGMDGDGEVRRQGPRRRRPDNDKDIFPGECAIYFCRIGLERKLHIDRRRRVLAILDLSFGERSLRACTPKNWLLRLIKQVAYSSIPC